MVVPQKKNVSRGYCSPSEIIIQRLYIYRMGYGSHPVIFLLLFRNEEGEFLAHDEPVD